ncbi:MAG TPA: N-6 DNA methylase, partial [Polyangiaceae bacterium]|nr:N-6 DNA methylase [Polyangiaceae bacterium]
MGEQTDEQTTLRQLVLAAQTAFGVLWPALATGRTKLSEEQRFEAVVASLVLSLCERYAIRAGLPAEPVRSSKLAALADPVFRLPPLEALAYRRAYDAALVAAWGTTEDPRLPSSRVSEIGAVYESLLALSSQTRIAAAARGRKPTGSYYTPAAIASQICETALLAHLERTAQPVLELLVLDPAVGAGAFLIQACRVLADELAKQRPRELSASQARAEVAATCLYGVDVNPLSVAVTELCLWLLVGDARLEAASLSKQLRHGDALIGVD